MLAALCHSLINIEMLDRLLLSLPTDALVFIINIKLCIYFLEQEIKNGSSYKTMGILEKRKAKCQERN